MTNSVKRNAYTFKEGLTMMAAKSVGIDPYLAAEAGEGAKAAINAIRHAAKTKNPKDRAALIRQAQTELRTISAAKHPKVVNAIQARLLALQGRGGDTEIAHVTPGEVVIPRSLQTPQLMRQIAALAARQGLDPQQLTVGHRANKVNPKTGQREFIEEIVVTGKRGGGSRGGVGSGGWGASYGLFNDHVGNDSGSGSNDPYLSFPEDDPEVPIVELPPGGFDTLLRTPGFTWNGVYFTDNAGNKFKVFESSGLQTIVVSSAKIISNPENVDTRLLLLGINTALRVQGESGDNQPIEEIVVEGSRLEAIRAEPHLATDQQLRWAMDQIWENAWESLNMAGAAVGLDASIEGFKDLSKLKGKRALVLAMALGIPIGGYWLAIALPIIAEMNKRGID